jgi:hypothetical protein
VNLLDYLNQGRNGRDVAKGAAEIGLIFHFGGSGVKKKI